jgi:hypothetical protein
MMTTMTMTVKPLSDRGCGGGEWRAASSSKGNGSGSGNDSLLQ